MLLSVKYEHHDAHTDYRRYFSSDTLRRSLRKSRQGQPKLTSGRPSIVALIRDLRAEMRVANQRRRPFGRWVRWE